LPHIMILENRRRRKASRTPRRRVDAFYRYKKQKGKVQGRHGHTFLAGGKGSPGVGHVPEEKHDDVTIHGPRECPGLAVGAPNK